MISPSSTKNNSNNEEAPPVRQGLPGIKPISLTVDNVFRKFRYGLFHDRLLFAAGMTTTANAMIILQSCFLEWTMVFEFDLTLTGLLMTIASLFLGNFVGLLLVTWMGARVRRRTIFLFGTFWMITFGLLTAVDTSFWLLLCTRFATGMGLAGTTEPFYALAEWTPHRYRGRTLLKLGWFWSLGTFFVPVIMNRLLFSMDSWRWHVCICTFSSFGSLLANYFFLPESPRWLMSHGHHNEEALNVFRTAARINRQDPWSICPEQSHLLGSSVKTTTNWKALNKLEKIRMVLCYLPIILLVDFLYYAIVFLKQFVLAGDDLKMSLDRIAYTSVGEFVGVALAVVSIDRFGRTITQGVTYFLAGSAVAAVCIGRHFEELETTTQGENIAQWTASTYLFYLSVVARTFIMAAVCVTWVHTFEILPKNIRIPMHQSARMLSSLGVASFPVLLFAPEGTYLKVGISIGALSFLAGLLALMLPETKELASGGTVGRRLSSNGAFSIKQNKHETTNSVQKDETVATLTESESLHIEAA